MYAGSFVSPCSEASIRSASSADMRLWISVADMVSTSLRRRRGAELIALSDGQTCARRTNAVRGVRRAADHRRVRVAVVVAMSTLTLSAPALASNGGTGAPDTASGGVVYGQAVRKI